MLRCTATAIFTLAMLLASQSVLSQDVTTSGADLRDSRLRGEQLADEQEVKRTGAEDRRSLTVTLYQVGLALVREGREVGLVSGHNQLVVEGVSPKLLPESLRISGEGDPRVLSQSYKQALLTRENLLKAHVGHEILLLRNHGGDAEEQVLGRLLSIAGDAPVVSMGGRIEVLHPGSPWRIAFRNVREDLSPVPGLMLDLETEVTGRQNLELLYLSGGLNWQADYVLDLDDEAMELTAWASIENDTGADLDMARLRLVAGEPNRSSGGGRMERAMTLSDTGVESRVQGGYHLFPLAEPVRLANGERTQIPLFRASAVPMHREYRMESTAWGPMQGEQSQAINVYLQFENAGEGLSRAMPSGTARVYQQDAEGETLFLGQDRIPATPAGNPVELRVGNAFDITALRSQQDYSKLDERSEQQEWRIQLSNASDRSVDVRVIERFAGDWTIIDSNLEHERVDADRAEWTVNVPAEGTAELSYEVEIRR